MDVNSWGQSESDEEIAKQVQLNEIELFGILINRYEKKIKRYGGKFLSREEDIEDIVQKIFIKAYRNIQSFDIKRKFSSWLYRIAHNEFVNELKKKKREPLNFFDPDIIFPHLPAREENGIHDIDKEMINKDLSKLPSKYREPIILRYFQELEYKEISDILNIPTSTVGIRLKRGIKKLKEIYERNK